MADDHHQMDTNGFTGHYKLRQAAKKRLMKIVISYCNHVIDGEHENCKDECLVHQGLIDAYKLFITT